MWATLWAIPNGRQCISSKEGKRTAMTTTKRNDAPSVALAEGYYYENGCTVASKVHLTERNYGTRRTFFFICDPAAVQAILPDGWILRATAEPEFHLMVHFNDWLHTSHADNTPHAVITQAGLTRLIVDLLIRTLRGLTRTAWMFH